MKRFIFTLVFILIVALGSYFYWKYEFTYSDGYRAGLLQKFSRKGTIFKTYEGEMILSSIRSNANMAIASEKFFFSVVDENLSVKIEKLQGLNIVVHYTEKNATLPWRGESTYLVDSVRVVQENELLHP